jgi:hypothetical protein
MGAAVAPLPQSKEARQSAALGRHIEVPTNAGVAAILLKLSAIESGNRIGMPPRHTQSERRVKGTKTCSLYCFRMSRPPATSK